MTPTPEFKSALTRVIRLFIYETKNGCTDCLTNPGKVCFEHRKVFADITLNPRKYLPQEYHDMLQNSLKKKQV